MFKRHTSNHCEHKSYDLAYEGNKVQEKCEEILPSNIRCGEKAFDDVGKLETKVDKDKNQVTKEMTRHYFHIK